MKTRFRQFSPSLCQSESNTYVHTLHVFLVVVHVCTCVYACILRVWYILLFVRIPTVSEKKQAIDVAYYFFTNERDYPLEGRRQAAERVCVPLMRSCDEVALRDFFCDHIGDIMTVIESSLSKVYFIQYIVYTYSTCMCM